MALAFVALLMVVGALLLGVHAGKEMGRKEAELLAKNERLQRAEKAQTVFDEWGPGSHFPEHLFATEGPAHAKNFELVTIRTSRLIEYVLDEAFRHSQGDTDPVFAQQVVDSVLTSFFSLHPSLEPETQERLRAAHAGYASRFAPVFLD